jgi:MYXO-CTERM domain-containing protein
VLRETKEQASFETTFTRRTFWTGDVACAAPKYDVWVPERGYGAGGGTGAPVSFDGEPAKAELETLIAEDVPTLELVAAQKATRPTPKKSGKRGCGCGAGGDGSIALAIIAFVLPLGLRPRRARRAPT